MTCWTGRKREGSQFDRRRTRTRWKSTHCHRSDGDVLARSEESVDQDSDEGGVESELRSETSEFGVGLKARNDGEVSLTKREERIAKEGDEP